MNFFDFHHHKKNTFGVYNYFFPEEIPTSYFSVGLHPKDIDEHFEEKLIRIKEISTHPNCVAIGECGLDALVRIDENLQKHIFLQQILWANEIGKPIIIHCVRRFSDVSRLKKKARIPMVIHGFNKKYELAQSLVQQGFYLSFGKALLYREALQQTVRQLPLDKILLETDDADVKIKELYNQLSEIKNRPVEDIQNRIKENISTILGRDIGL
jgi:TatD DNase family protein